MKNIILLILSSIILISCDPGLINNYVIENQSDYLIETKVRLKQGQRKSNSSDSIQVIKVKPKSKVKIIDYAEIGNTHDKKQFFLEEFDTISIRINGMKISKNINNRVNWRYEVIREELLSLDEVQYNFVIENTDLTKIE